jgi:hypothetical protein
VRVDGIRSHGLSHLEHHADVCDVNASLVDRMRNAVLEMRVGPSRTTVQKESSNCRGAAVAQKAVVVSDCGKALSLKWVGKC